MAGNERALGHLRGTDDWARLDPGHVALIDMFGAKPSGADVLAAFDACHTANVRLVELFHQVPLLLTPTVAGQVGAPGAQGTVDGEETPSWVAFTYPFNMTRSPAGTVCVGFTEGGPARSDSRSSARSTPTSRCCGRWPSWRTRWRSIGSLRSEPRWYRSRSPPGARSSAG